VSKKGLTLWHFYDQPVEIRTIPIPGAAAGRPRMKAPCEFLAGIHRRTQLSLFAMALTPERNSTTRSLPHRGSYGSGLDSTQRLPTDDGVRQEELCTNYSHAQRRRSMR